MHQVFAAPLRHSAFLCPGAVIGAKRFHISGVAAAMLTSCSLIQQSMLAFEMRPYLIVMP